MLLSVPEAASELSVSVPTIYKAARALEELGMLREITGRERSRVWAYQEYLSIPADGAESEREAGVP